MRRIKQINNLVIKYDDALKMNYFGTMMKNPLFDKYSVWHGRTCLEDRMTLEQAVEYATKTRDYVMA